MKNKRTNFGWPFENSGYMSTERMFAILLFKVRDRICKKITENEKKVIDRDFILREYKRFLSDCVTGLEYDEKKYLEYTEKEEKKGLGFVEPVLKHTSFDIYIGGCCKNPENIFEIGFGEELKSLDFYGLKTSDEIERVIRLAAIKYTGHEITMLHPEIKTSEFYAIRPPQGQWGMIIRRWDERDRLCGNRS